MEQTMFISHQTHLSDEDPKEQQCDVPHEEKEGGTDPQVVEQREVQQPSYTVQRVGWAGGEEHIAERLLTGPEAFLIYHNKKTVQTCSNEDSVFYRSMLLECILLILNISIYFFECELMIKARKEMIE